jgi:hypothetical protein
MMGESFWQKNSLITRIFSELQPIIIFSPVANFGYQSIVEEEKKFPLPNQSQKSVFAIELSRIKAFIV